MKKESFIAGYSFVKGVRAVAYTLLLSGLLGAIVWGVMKIVTTSTDLAAASAAYDVQTELIEQAKVKLEETRQKFAKEEQEFIDGRQRRIADARKKLSDSVEAFNREASIALEEVKKVSPLSSGYQFAPLQIPELETPESCEEYLKTVEAKMQTLEPLKQEMYKSIFTGMDELVGSVQEKKDALLFKISVQQQLIAQLEQEIQNIRNSYRVTRKIITETPRETVIMNKSPLYEAQAKEDDRITVANQLPSATSVVMANDLLNSNQVADFRRYVARLIGWLPVLRESPVLKTESTQEGVDPNPELTEEDKARIKNLEERIAKCREEIRNMQQEIMPLDQQLETLAQVKSSLSESQSSVLSDWTVTTKASPVKNAAATLKKEIADFPTELQKLKDLHAAAIATLEKQIESAEFTRDTVWNQACKLLAINLLLWGVCGVLAIVAVSWVVWAIILIIMDFVVSNLIIAMRAQDIQLLLEKNMKN